MLTVLTMVALMEVSAVRPVRRGDTLYEDDLKGPDAEIALLVGKQARRPIREGHRVRPTDVTAPVAVLRQSAVEVRFVRGALTLRTEGRVLQNGRVGEAVDVLLSGRRKPVMGVVKGPGIVEVGS